MRVLRQPAIAYADEAEDPLDDAKRMFNLGANPRFGVVLRLLNLVDHTAMLAATVGEILRIRRNLADSFALAAIRLIAPHPRLFAVQQVRQDGAIGHIGGR